MPHHKFTTHTSTTAAIANMSNAMQLKRGLTTVAMHSLSAANMGWSGTVLSETVATTSFITAPGHHGCPGSCNQRRSVMQQRMEAVMSFASGEADTRGRAGSVAYSPCIHAGQMMRHLDDYRCFAE